MVSNDVLTDSRVLRHAGSLGRRGHDVVVLGVKSKRTALEEQRERFKIIRVRLKAYEKLQSLADSIKGRHARSRGLQRGAAAVASAVSPSFPRQLLRESSDTALFVSQLLDTNLTMSKKARRLDADVYTSNNLDVLPAGVIASGRRGDRYLVYDAHELWSDMSALTLRLRALFYDLEKALIRKAQAVMTINEFIASELARRYRIPTPEIVYNCPERFSIPANPKRGARVIALYHGIFSSYRGLENLVLSSKHLEKDVLLLMRGAGELETKLRDLASDRSNCQFEDIVPQKEVIMKAAEADVGIIPYLPTNWNNYLCSPNKLFEYIQAGVPVVASDLPFLRKVIIGEDIGLTFDPYDPKDIASTINKVTRERELTRLRQNVRKAAEKWCWEREEPKLLQIYDRLEEH